jgi:hypothetical protein
MDVRTGLLNCAENIFEAASSSYRDLSRYGIVRKLPDSVFKIHHTENLVAGTGLFFSKLPSHKDV